MRFDTITHKSTPDIVSNSQFILLLQYSVYIWCRHFSGSTPTDVRHGKGNPVPSQDIPVGAENVPATENTQSNRRLCPVQQHCHGDYPDAVPEI